MKNYTVRTEKMNGQDVRESSFGSYQKALDYYTNRLDELNISRDSAEWPADGVKVDLVAGGRGYDYRLKLIVTEED